MENAHETIASTGLDNSHDISEDDNSYHGPGAGPLKLASAPTVGQPCMSSTLTVTTWQCYSAELKKIKYISLLYSGRRLLVESGVSATARSALDKGGSLRPSATVHF